jgi:SpoVK/Ycf46/Vps4 family AAA+-type ATPase
MATTDSALRTFAYAALRRLAEAELPAPALPDLAGHPLSVVAARARLTPQETALLALLVVAEQDEAAQQAIVDHTGDRDRHRIELGMLPALLDAAPTVAGPDSGLVRAALVEAVPRGAFARTTLVVPPRLLWAMWGDTTQDPALGVGAELLTADLDDAGECDAVLVVGADRVRRRQAAAAVLTAPRLLAGVAPDHPAAWAALVREATLSDTAVLLEVDGALDTLGRVWVERARHLSWALSSSVRLPLDTLPRRTWTEVEASEHAPDAAEWAFVLGADVERRHHLSAAQLDTMAQAMLVTGRDPVAAYRRLADARLDKLATHIPPRAGWEDLVLSPSRKGTLRDLVNRYQQAERVYDEWGFPASPSRGVVALFAGPSGTGKTLSAEVVAGELGLDLYRLDLSSVVSKYIGETEKNLDELFDAAAIGNTVLFFDEADSLFGKRTDVSDSHDRYANVETSYLLQRLERYEGVVVLCTNYEKNIDQAFLRRVHVRLEFAMPTEAERAELWRRNLKASAPLADDIDLDLLVREFDLSGAGIRNAVIDAAFLAAAGGTSIGMEHLVRGVARELHKLGRMVNESQFGRWYDAALATTAP